MLVALPVCAKDASHVLANLDHIHRLEGRTKLPYTCLVTYDRAFAAERPHLVEEAARSVFAQVLTCVYEPWPGTPAWPAPQNHAWTSTVRHVFDMGTLRYADGTAPAHTHEPWLWWEADATPLVSGWLDTLAQEYRAALACGKVFAGPITRMGHMNGVAVYPWDTLRYCPKTMLTSHTPFDIALSSEVGTGMVHDLSHVIHHYPRWTGIRLRVTDRRVSQALVRDGYVLHHGCNDGSLRTCLWGVKPDRLVDAPPHEVHTLQLSTYASLPDETLARWQSTAHARHQRGYPMVPLSTCTHDYPALAHQAEGLKDTSLTILPLPLNKNLGHLNPALVRHPDGHLYLVPRRWTRTSIGWHSDMPLYRMDATTLALTPIRPLMLPKRHPSEQHEDPRLHASGNKLFLSYCSWQPGPIYAARQRLSVLDPNWKELVTDELPYGNNTQSRDGVQRHEKNWLWFHHDNRLHLLYSYDPHIVVELRGHRDIVEHVVRNPSRTWAWGDIRGGTPPVRVGDEYITFAHSSVPWRGRQNRYVMLAYAFSTTPPFTPLRMTSTPLLIGSEHDTRILGGPLVVFPCGAVLDGDTWLVSMGVNDEAVGLLRLPHATLNTFLAQVSNP